MKTIEQIISDIDNTIAARKEQLPAIKAERVRVAHKLSSIEYLQEQLDELLAAGPDETASAEIGDAKRALARCSAELERYCGSLDELEAANVKLFFPFGVSTSSFASVR